MSVYDALDEARTMYYAYRQEPEESNTKYLRNFKSIVASVEHLRREMFADDALIALEKKMESVSEESLRTIAHYKKVFKDKMIGVAFIKRAGQQRYEKLITSICDQHFF